MEQNLIHREIQEELDRRADHRRGVGGEVIVPLELFDEEVLQRRVQPRGEHDQGDGEHDVDRQSDSNICAGVERLFAVDKEGDDLGADVRGVADDKVTEASRRNGIDEDPPTERLVIQLADRGDQLEQIEQRELDDHGQKADEDELDELPERDERGALFLGFVVDIFENCHCFHLIRYCAIYYTRCCA